MGSPRRKAGLLAPHVEDYRAWLTDRGYTPGTVTNMLKDGGTQNHQLRANERCVVQIPWPPVGSFHVRQRAPS